jgi:hypothetical protein
MLVQIPLVSDVATLVQKWLVLVYLQENSKIFKCKDSWHGHSVCAAPL